MRKFVSAVAITAGLTLLAGPAFAQQYPPTTPSTNPGASTTEELTVSDTTVAPGEPFTISGEGADPNALVTFTARRSSSALGGGRALAAGPGLAALSAAVRPQAQGAISLGSTTANGAGEFSATLEFPAGTDPGVYTVTASSGGDVLAVVTVRVLASAGAGLGDLPFTGGNVLPGLAIGAALIVAGGLLLLSLKRRRSVA
jgi:LPXTG cell wall anchor motif